jgi:preprotein translocase subunit Sec63
MAPKRKSSDAGSSSKPKRSRDVLSISEKVQCTKECIIHVTITLFNVGNDLLCVIYQLNFNVFMYVTRISRYIYSVRYYPRFHVTAVGLGTYYPRIQGALLCYVTIISFIMQKMSTAMLWLRNPSINNHKLFMFAVSLHRNPSFHNHKLSTDGIFVAW